MLFTGDAITADVALRAGLVSHVFDTPEKMQTFVDETAARIKSLPRDVIALGKAAFVRQTQMRNKEEAMNFGTCSVFLCVFSLIFYLRLAVDVMVDNLQHEQCKSGLEAFAKKEKPRWD